MTPRIEDVLLLVTTDRIAECRAFCERHFGFEVAFEAPIHLQMASPDGGGRRFSLAFMPTITRSVWSVRPPSAARGSC